MRSIRSSKGAWAPSGNSHGKHEFRSAGPRAQPQGRVPHRQGNDLRGGQGRLVRHPAQSHRGTGGRIGQRQVGHLAGDPGLAAAGELDRRPGERNPLRRQESRAPRPVDAARAARRRHLDDLPGADDVAEPGVHRRLPADRGAAAAHGDEARAGEKARDRAPGRGRYPGPRVQDQRLSVADVRRPAAARDDRDGDRLRAEAPHRRRADDRARRDDPEADPRPHRRAAEEASYVGALHHPRPRGGRRDRRLRGGDAQRRNPRAGARQERVRDADRPVHAGAAEVPAAARPASGALAGDRRLHGRPHAGIARHVRARARREPRRSDRARRQRPRQELLLARGHSSARGRSRRSRTSRSSCRRARRWGSSANRVPARRPSGSR